MRLVLIILGLCAASFLFGLLTGPLYPVISTAF